MILDSLNPAQQEAVQAPLGHQLVLAGAGSGKTRVLIHRIAWLIEQENISPFHILAVTFTNKAAHEMRSRLEGMLHINTKAMWIGTFHGLSHRFLRTHWQEAGLAQSFQILDAEDQFRLIRRVIHALNLDEERFPPKELQWFINGQKEEGRGPHQVQANDYASQTFVKIYQTYQDACQRACSIDFADLLWLTCKTLETNPELRAHYQARFRCLLVDEFQDTNAIQYTWLKLFTGATSAIMIVGDDDQSIYGWRGAIGNMHHFSDDFPQATIIRLEQNYRSSGIILKAANALIAKNAGRLGKNLWTDDKEGERITLYDGLNEADEAFYIANQIRKLHQGNYELRDIAVLYRSNAQSRVIEEALMQLSIAYRVYGGLRYFDRQEIKDALAYLRLLVNPVDDAAFERIINMPSRGIGDRTLDAIRDHAKNTRSSLWTALQELLAQEFFSARAGSALTAFLHLMQTLTENTQALALHQQVEYVLQHSGLIEHYRKEKGGKGLARIENLEELVNAAHQFGQDAVTDHLPPLTAFLAYAALESSDTQGDTKEDGVQLMTLHSAKGLEFPVVFLSGCEEELFPHYLSMNDPKALEEERRLCYVGITRAMRKLFMTYAKVRRTYGKEAYHRPSRFLQEIPSELVEQQGFHTKTTKLVPGLPRKRQAERSDIASSLPGLLRIGQTVQHRVFGDGVVLACEGEGENTKVTVKFVTVGTKILIAQYLTAL